MLSILRVNEISKEEISEDITCDNWIHYKYAPASSKDIQFIFLNYKHILSNHQRWFLFENLKHILIVQCNSIDVAVDMFKTFCT